MKPLGPIPAGYGAIDGVLAIGSRPVTALVEEAGETPLFVYSQHQLEERVALLRRAMPRQLKIHYALKANPYGPLLQVMSELVDGFDIASAGEMALAFKAGVSPQRISFAGPGKRDAELAAAIRHDVTLNLESEAEAERVAQSVRADLQALDARIGIAERAVAVLDRQLLQYDQLLRAGELQFDAGRRSLQQLISLRDSRYAIAQRRADQANRLLAARLRQLALTGQLLPALGLGS